MDGVSESIRDFFAQLWSFATAKHEQGAYNTACLAVLLTLPLLVLLATLAVCCHCCCCRHAICCRRCKGATARSETKKRRGNSAEDLWISVKTGTMTPDGDALAMV
ncbi:hypothetical protein EYF80_044452 [Liparis tanakae]|uniref:KIAA0040 n=1 Tax=Liparis tanakae TaxID=230148 RepID=A0A4Z2FVR5_9TELE|nr:hypothetical protein EYF80_044452 [Liparis tanakae]